VAKEEEAATSQAIVDGLAEEVVGLAMVIQEVVLRLPALWVELAQAKANQMEV